MARFQDVTLTDSIEIGATPEQVFRDLASVVHDESYRRWHPTDHVSFRRLEGEPWQENSDIPFPAALLSPE